MKDDDDFELPVFDKYFKSTTITTILNDNNYVVIPVVLSSDSVDATTIFLHCFEPSQTLKIDIVQTK